jgi:hypothetical protein
VHGTCIRELRHVTVRLIQAFLGASV